MIEQFYSLNYDRLVNQITRKVAGNREVAEDIVQEAFEKAIKFFPSYNEKRGKLSTWFNTILYNVLRDAQRKNKECSEIGIEELSVSNLLNGVHPQSEEFSKEIREQIYSSKNLRHRDILEMFFIYGFTSKEIPYMLDGVSQSNVTTVVKRFKESFKNE